MHNSDQKNNNNFRIFLFSFLRELRPTLAYNKINNN